MRTPRPVLLLALAGLAAAVAGTVGNGCAMAFDGSTDVAAPNKPLPIFKNPQAALRAGLEDFKVGDSRSAIEALKYAAAGGKSLARWKLAKMYADGDGVPQDDIKAYQYFSQIVANYDEDDPNPREVVGGLERFRRCRRLQSERHRQYEDQPRADARARNVPICGDEFRRSECAI